MVPPRAPIDVTQRAASIPHIVSNFLNLTCQGLIRWFVTQFCSGTRNTIPSRKIVGSLAPKFGRQISPNLGSSNKAIFRVGHNCVPPSKMEHREHNCVPPWNIENASLCSLCSTLNKRVLSHPTRLSQGAENGTNRRNATSCVGPAPHFRRLFVAEICPLGAKNGTQLCAPPPQTIVFCVLRRTQSK